MTQPQLRIRPINLLDIFAYDHSVHRITNRGINYFNWCLKREMVFDLKGLTDLSLLFHDLTNDQQISRIARFWQDDPPQAVISVTPLYNPVLYRCALTANPNALCVTIPVDFEEFRDRYWFTPKMQQQHYLLATPALVAKAERLQIPAEKLHPIGGMIIDPAFYQPPPTNIPERIAALGLDPSLPTGMVSFGAQGSVMVSRVARQITDASLPVNMIYLCGHNEPVYQEVQQMASPYPKVVFRYAPDPPVTYHYLSDFVIGKPGSMTLTEALITETPFIFVKAGGLAPLQRGNERWVLEHGTGIVANGVRQVVPAIRQVISNENIRQQTRRHFHRGVFDAASVILELLNSQTVDSYPMRREYTMASGN